MNVNHWGGGFARPVPPGRKPCGSKVYRVHGALRGPLEYPVAGGEWVKSGSKVGQYLCTVLIGRVEMVASTSIHCSPARLRYVAW